MVPLHTVIGTVEEQPDVRKERALLDLVWIAMGYNRYPEMRFKGLLKAER